MKTKNIMLGLALLATGLMANAQNAGQVKPINQYNQKGLAFVDNNKDGICDNYGSQKGVRGNGQGICNGQGAGNGQGMRNGQGKGNPNCIGAGRGQGKGNPQGRNFIDANNNGVYDRFENTPQSK